MNYILNKPNSPRLKEMEMSRSMKERLVIIWFCVIILSIIWTAVGIINLIVGIIIVVLLLGLGYLVWLNDRGLKD
jgi:hypothetical protein